MPLTTHLAKKKSVYNILIEELPLLRGLDGKEALGFSKFKFPNKVTQQDLIKSHAILAGQAFDRLQILLTMNAWEEEKVRMMSDYCKTAYPLFEGMLDWLNTTRDLGAKSLVLGLFAQMYFVGPEGVIESKSFKHLFEANTIEDFASMLPKEILNDLKEMTECNTAILSKYKYSNPKVAHPVFAGSLYVDGADADAIYGSSLIELKTYSSISYSKIRDAILQAAAYALLDWDDKYGIETIEVWFARFGYSYEIPLNFLVKDLSSSRQRVKQRLKYRHVMLRQAADERKALLSST